MKQSELQDAILNIRLAWSLFAVVMLLLAQNSWAYPLDGFERTGISRLEGYYHALKTISGERNLLPGARLESHAIRLRLNDKQVTLPTADPLFTTAVRNVLGQHVNAISLAVLDVTDPDHVSYAAHNADQQFMLASCGKILVALAVLQGIADLYPNDIVARERLLKETLITADSFINNDHHVVPFWQKEDGLISFRGLQVGDRANLWTYLDWMLSASSSAAASMLMKQVVLMQRFGANYPPVAEEAVSFFRDSPTVKLREYLIRGMSKPLVRSGLNSNLLMQYSLFTSEGKRQIGTRGSAATPQELVRLLLLMEQGLLIDRFSSLELKRLLYLTQRRTRYDSADVLQDSAVYIKTGSYYRCGSARKCQCAKYRGNSYNLMNTVALVESPAGSARFAYLVALTSNVPCTDSSLLHRQVATGLQQVIEERHPQLRAQGIIRDPQIVEIKYLLPEK